MGIHYCFTLIGEDDLLDVLEEMMQLLIVGRPLEEVFELTLDISK